VEGITAENLWALLLAGASALVLLANAGEKVAKIVQTLKAPNANQDKRLDELEDWRESVDRMLASDKKHLENIDEGNRATQRALLALLDHGIDGNNIKQMQAAKDELRSYLISR
jgi:hypothetical protein